MRKQLIFGWLAFLALSILGACDEDNDTKAMGGTAVTNAYVDVDVAKAKMMIDTMPDLMVIDVSPAWDKGHLPRAQNLPLGSGALDKAIPMLDKTKPYLVYCHADEPSIAGANKLIAAGIQKVYRLTGNYAAWVGAGYPVEK